MQHRIVGPCAYNLLASPIELARLEWRRTPYELVDDETPRGILRRVFPTVPTDEGLVDDGVAAVREAEGLDLCTDILSGAGDGVKERPSVFGVSRYDANIGLQLEDSKLADAA